MISVKAEKVGDGWDTTTEVHGRSDCLFQELRSLMSVFFIR